MRVSFPRHREDDPCFVAPSPELRERLGKDFARMRGRAKGGLLVENVPLAPAPRALGLDDGVIIPPGRVPGRNAVAHYPRRAAERAPLRGAVRVVVVLVDFTDKHMAATRRPLPGAVLLDRRAAARQRREYYTEVTNGLVDITGEVVGPYRMPQTLAWYANGNFGHRQDRHRHAAHRQLAHDAAVAADPTSNFAPYDNDGNGFVDAFIVVHAGRGGEETGNSGDIWSHKWTLPTAVQHRRHQDLRLPDDPRGRQDRRLRPRARPPAVRLPRPVRHRRHVGGHRQLVPDGGRLWNGGGDIPAHPSAWCKANQGWVAVTNVTTNGTRHGLRREDRPQGAAAVEGRRAAAQSTSCVENRQRTGYDAELPGDGLLIWHIDEAQPTNTDENHYKVGARAGRRQPRPRAQRTTVATAATPTRARAANRGFSPTSAPSSKATRIRTPVSRSRRSPRRPRR